MDPNTSSGCGCCAAPPRWKTTAVRRWSGRAGLFLGTGFLLDAPIPSDLIRHPRGKIFDGIKRVDEANISTSMVVAAELRFEAAKKNLPYLTTQLETTLRAIEVLALEAPGDAIYGAIRNRLEKAGQPIGANELWIAAHALTLGHTLVTDHERAFSKVRGLRVENWLSEPTRSAPSADPVLGLLPDFASQTS